MSSEGGGTLVPTRKKAEEGEACMGSHGNIRRWAQQNQGLGQPPAWSWAEAVNSGGQGPPAYLP